MQQSQNAQKLDGYLKEVVQALHQTVAWGMSHQADKKEVDKALQDCKEILNVIMDGKVSEWVN